MHIEAITDDSNAHIFLVVAFGHARLKSMPDAVLISTYLSCQVIYCQSCTSRTLGCPNSEAK